MSQTLTDLADALVRKLTSEPSSQSVSNSTRDSFETVGRLTAPTRIERDEFGDRPVPLEV